MSHNEKEAPSSGSGGATDPKVAQNSEIWNQVGMLEEGIGYLGDSIDALYDNLETAGVLLPPPPVDPVDEELAPETRLGKTLQDFRCALHRYRERLCIMKARLGV
jgi:hypothetical protein